MVYSIFRPNWILTSGDALQPSIFRFPGGQSSTHSLLSPGWSQSSLEFEWSWRVIRNTVATHPGCLVGLVIHWSWEATHSHLVIGCDICHHPWFPEDLLLLGAVLRHLWWQWISRGVCGCSLQCRQQMPPKYPAGSWRSSFWTRQYYIFHCAMAAMAMALAMSSDPASNSFALRSETSELASEKISGCVWWGAVEGSGLMSAEGRFSTF